MEALKCYPHHSLHITQDLISFAKLAGGDNQVVYQQLVLVLDMLSHDN